MNHAEVPGNFLRGDFGQNNRAHPRPRKGEFEDEAKDEDD